MRIEEAKDLVQRQMDELEMPPEFQKFTLDAIDLGYSIGKRAGERLVMERDEGFIEQDLY